MYRKIGILLTASLFILAGCRINTPPVITNFSASPTSGGAPLTVTFYASATDADDDPITCTLDYGDGSTKSTFSCTDAAEQTHTYNAGAYTATLTVSDGRGGSDARSLSIDVTGLENACPAPSGSSLGAQPLTTEKEPEGMAPFDGLAYKPGELLVYRGGVGLQSARVVELEHELGLQALDAPLTGWVRYRVPAGQEAELAQQILSAGLGSYVQPNYAYRLLATPNDTYYITYQQTQYDLMQVSQSWDLISASSCNPIVAVVDSGVAYDHVDLDAYVINGYDFSDSDSDPYPNPGDDHGTMVASIIAAETNNNQGMAGTTGNRAYIMPLKVFPNAYSTTIADAINWAVQYNAHIINLSLCITDSNGACADLTDSPDVAIETALQNAYDNGIVSLAASGNDGNSFVGYPASSQYTIAVGAINDDKTRASFSNYGTLLDVVAPGVSVLSASIPSTTDPPYLFGDGTSFATPYAAGVASLYISQYYAQKNALPSPSQIISCMRSAAEDLGTTDTGSGLVRADRMLDASNNLYGCY
ncbi:S8 family serine peptidase [Oceanithermus sp.]